MAFKRPDELGAWSCSRCHDAVDGRIDCDWPKKDLLLFHYEGVFRTLEILLKEGVIKS